MPLNPSRNLIVPNRQLSTIASEAANEGFHRRLKRHRIRLTGPDITDKVSLCGWPACLRNLLISKHELICTALPLSSGKEGKCARFEPISALASSTEELEVITRGGLNISHTVGVTTRSLDSL